MSFNGDLEHFPLVDVIQLLHMTSKTGILFLKSPKGESQLVFHEGYLVSANHLNNNVRIGKVLVDMGAITDNQLNEALAAQKKAGNARKPLVATLIELGTIDKETAFKGLESLIELTIVEVLTWATGTFTLDVSKEYVSDEYRYYPEMLQQEILLNAQGVLMDALRIYDEKMRDGTLSKVFFSDENQVKAAPDDNSASPDITADLLGLDGLDNISREIPDLFTGLKDNDPVEDHRQLVAHALPETAIDRQEQLISFLAGIPRASVSDDGPPVTAIILLSQNELLSHCVTTVCRNENLFVFTTDEEAGLDVIIEQHLERDLHPVLIIDIPHDKEREQAISLVHKKGAEYPQTSILIAACCHTWDAISIEVLRAGARSIIPRPCRQCHEDTYVPQMIAFLSVIGSFLKTILPLPHPQVGQQFIACLNQLKTLSEPPEIALVLLNFAADQFERAMTFVVSKTELIAEKSIGVTTSKSDGPTSPLMFKISLDSHSVLQEAVEKGRLYYGQRNDAILTEVLYKEIGAPHSPKAMIVPLVSRGKVIAVTYADFGSKAVTPPQIGLMEALAQYAGAILDNALYRNKIGKTG
ncbi:MAG: DUF4388 domain-containing protein [Desulfuromonadaceae bacterium]|nr:DUF4388 domain-containing protein [Desulfuromonadaceae bacterium]